MTVAESFKNARLSKNLSQDELADMLKISKTMISRIERGCKVPSVNILIDMAKCLHCTTDTILGLDQNED